MLLLVMEGAQWQKINSRKSWGWGC